MTSPLREALRELVALKDLKDSIIDAAHGPNHPLRLEYYRRKPLVWEAARQALSQNGEHRDEVIKLVNEQAKDESLWFVAEHAPEAHLQQALRRLHAAVEAHNGEPVAWLEVGPLGDILGVTLKPDGFLKAVPLYARPTK